MARFGVALPVTFMTMTNGFFDDSSCVFLSLSPSLLSCLKCIAARVRAASLRRRNECQRVARPDWSRDAIVVVVRRSTDFSGFAPFIRSPPFRLYAVNCVIQPLRVFARDEKNRRRDASSSLVRLQKIAGERRRVCKSANKRREMLFRVNTRGQMVFV